MREREIPIATPMVRTLPAVVVRLIDGSCWANSQSVAVSVIDPRARTLHGGFDGFRLAVKRQLVTEIDLMNQRGTLSHSMNSIRGIKLPVQRRARFDEDDMAIVPTNMMQRHGLSLLTELHRNTHYLLGNKKELTNGNQ